ncbi:DUF2304 domain-containing protein [Mucilaginibacter ginsenosidivorans]|uniref:DUF2304 domain-containing protein n=1 Tax=Mucilaginibacter ginsenosidivorans TaxID=398053 RepID=A0A5B8UUR9_9SPHI|nr:DUF2304 domain-containing protein [Mucilaginibacter ginsenosidivorans]QEC62176.1 DUF2304 domain-containing protein [Mucilaginibacter ginsenosidivorans]
MLRIQIITIIANILFILYISRLIVKGKLREEYAIVWIICTVFLMVFSFWTDGLELLRKVTGVVVAANLVFTGFIFAILIYLLHLSVVASKLYNDNKKLGQEIALLKEEFNKHLESKK